MRSADLQRRFLTNTGVILPARVLSAAVSLVTVPVVVWKLGIGGFGIWEASLAFSSLSSLFFMPLGGTLLWKASAAFGGSRAGESDRLLRLGVSATLVFLGVAGPAAWFTRHALVNLFRVPPELRGAAVWVLPGLVCCAALGGVNESLGAVLAGRQESGRVASAQTVGLCVNYAIVVGGLVGGLGFWSVLVGSAGGFLSTAMCLYVFMSRGSVFPSLFPAVPSVAELKPLVGYFGLLSIGSVSSALREQTDKLILIVFASPAWTGYYSIAFRLASLVTLVSNIFYVPVIALAGALHTAGDEDGVRRTYSQTVAILVTAAGIVAVVVAGTWDEIVIFWLGKPIPEVAPLLAWLMIGNVSAVLLTGSGTAVCRGIGRPGIETRYLVLSLLLNAMLTVILVVTFGPTGTVVATGISWAVASAVFVVFLHRFTELPRSASRMAAGALGCAAAAILLTRAVAPAFEFGIGRLAALASGGILATISVTTYFGLLALAGLSPFPLIRQALAGVPFVRPASRLPGSGHE
jgi:O-antigen/teichoic acid export membrane protein